MTKHTILAIVIGAIIILGASAAFLYSRINQNSNESAVTAQKQESASEEVLTPETIAGLLSKGENAKCTFNTQSEEGNSSGTIYISGENARAELEVNLDEDKILTNIIRSGDTFYMWGDTLETGIKMEMDIDEWAETANETQSNDSTAGFDPKAQVDFKCSSWTVDSALFSPPEDIEFISFKGFTMPAAATPDGAQTSESVNQPNTQNQCNICNALTGDAKNVCLQQFNCE